METGLEKQSSIKEIKEKIGREGALERIHRTALKIDMLATLLKNNDNLFGIDYMLEDFAKDIYIAYDTLTGEVRQ